jgi:5-methylcytosine-specific restriction endonuclease McrA
MTKDCTKCGATKSVEDFHKRAASRDGLSYWCKDCSRAKAREWARAHPDEAKKRCAEWVKNNPERHAESKRRWHLANPRDPARHAQAMREWVARNPERAREIKRIGQQARIARIAGSASFQVSIKDVRRILSAPCAVDGCNALDIQIDHIVPLARGGQHRVGNLQPLCGFHNRSKNKRLWIEFRVYLRTRSAA